MHRRTISAFYWNVRTSFRTTERSGRLSGTRERVSELKERLSGTRERVLELKERLSGTRERLFRTRERLFGTRERVWNGGTDGTESVIIRFRMQGHIYGPVQNKQ